MTTTRTGHPEVLVVYASRNGGTAGIADTIADELRANGLTVDVMSAHDASGDTMTLAGYGTVVLGSALYRGHWEKDALHFLRRHAVMLRGRRVWLFQSGPCGPQARADSERGAHEPAAVRRLREDVEAEPPITFGGVLDPATAHGFLARAMARGELAGDYRDPDRIRSWARTLTRTGSRPGGAHAGPVGRAV
ncbi:flavodoxin domain-containing protein [Pseudonocardia ailaonensis]|uniref:Flavodoxin domain-containing protein n=1 Tax=Pseudonocardia ailaonensis TaxID=367279 RepID=A0ABN2NPJ5_9PSEU